MKASEFLTKNLLLLSIFSFVLVASTSLTLTEPKRKVEALLKPNKVSKEFPANPILKDNVTVPIISAQSAYAIDLASGVTLFEKNANKPLLPASTTKIITALVAMEHFDEETVIKVGPETRVVGQKMGLVVGEEIKVIDLFYGLLVKSANDAAEVLAANYPGGRETFIGEMNTLASRLNLENTHFTNPSGLDGVEHVSTAKDMVRISSFAMENERFAEIVGTKNAVAESTNGKKHFLTNINQLLGEVDGVLGVKTGWTQNARENLVTYIERGDKKIMMALLGGQDRFGETKELIEWIYSNYEWKKVIVPN